ncbi:hypothetical protein ACE6H2_026798 [Prunus campanulata]
MRLKNGLVWAKKSRLSCLCLKRAFSKCNHFVKGRSTFSATIVFACNGLTDFQVIQTRHVFRSASWLI